MKLDLVITAPVRSASPSQRPFPENGRREDLMNHTFGARRCPYFLFCVSMCFGLGNPPTIMWYQCWIKNLSYTNLCLWMWQSGGACMCNTVLTFGSLLVVSGRDNHSHFLQSHRRSWLFTDVFSYCIFYSSLILITYAFFSSSFFSIIACFATLIQHCCR